MSLNHVWVEMKILPRPDILDVQGRAIVRTLVQNEKSIQDCRCGKCLQLCVQAKNPEEAVKKVKDMARFVLYNPLTETYQLSVMNTPDK